jgi:anti-anti-sigma regulatory factor
MEKFPCDVRSLRADVAAVDALARLQLAARQAGFELRLVHASAELTCLIELTGLAGVLRVEPGRQPEERE